MKVVIWAVILLVLGAVLYKFVVPAAFVAVGRGSIGPDTVTVERVHVGAEAVSESGEKLTASPGNKFVHFDLLIKAPFDQFDVYDFQLVKTKAASLGAEENIGDNLKLNYFTWSALDTNNEPVGLFKADAPETHVRVSFQVPAGASTGFLFYWGEYFGPLSFGT